MRAASLLKTAFPIVAQVSGLRSALALRYRGAGTIFMLHSVVERGEDYPDHSLRCPAERLADGLAASCAMSASSSCRSTRCWSG